MSFASNAHSMLEDADGRIALLQLINLRRMIQHRDFSVQELADAAGYTTTYVVKILSGYTYVNEQNWEDGMLSLDNAVTKLTEQRGYVCLCSKHTVEAIKSYLKEGS